MKNDIQKNIDRLTDNGYIYISLDTYDRLLEIDKPFFDNNVYHRSFISYLRDVVLKPNGFFGLRLSKVTENQYESLVTFFSNGHNNGIDDISVYDLINYARKHDVYINICRDLSEDGRPVAFIYAYPISVD